MDFPDNVIDTAGYVLSEAQNGRDHPAIKRIGECYEIKIDDISGTYRVVYYIKTFIYVLDCFHKKSKKGIAVPIEDKRRMQERLKMAKTEEKRHGK